MLRWLEPKKRAPDFKWPEIFLLWMGHTKIPSNIIHTMSWVPPEKTRLKSQLKMKKKRGCAKVVGTKEKGTVFKMVKDLPSLDGKHKDTLKYYSYDVISTS